MSKGTYQSTALLSWYGLQGRHFSTARTCFLLKNTFEFVFLDGRVEGRAWCVTHVQRSSATRYIIVGLAGMTRLLKRAWAGSTKLSNRQWMNGKQSTGTQTPRLLAQFGSPRVRLSCLCWSGNNSKDWCHVCHGSNLLP